MLLRTLNPAGNPADLAALLPVFRAYHAEAMPGFPEPGEARLRSWTRAAPRTTARIHAVFADESSTEALGAIFTTSELDVNRELMNSRLLVPSAGHESGVAVLLLDEARRTAEAEGRRRMITDSPSNTAGADSLTAIGGRKVHTTTRSVLDLAGVERARYAGWAGPSAKNGEYEVVRWVDRCPDELADSFCEAQRAMGDAPLEDLVYDHPEHDTERLRAYEEHTRSAGIRRHVLAAVDPNGRVAGLHMFVTMSDEPETVDIWDTCVVREHRGHGLGLRLKAAASLWMLEQRPSSRWVHTFNNHENEHMLAVNRTMGYRAAENWYIFEFPAARTCTTPGPDAT